VDKLSYFIDGNFQNKLGEKNDEIFLWVIAKHTSYVATGMYFPADKRVMIVQICMKQRSLVVDDFPRKVCSVYVHSLC
jgi:hypothetical protein